MGKGRHRKEQQVTVRSEDAPVNTVAWPSTSEAHAMVTEGFRTTCTAGRAPMVLAGSMICTNLVCKILVLLGCGPFAERDRPDSWGMDRKTVKKYLAPRLGSARRCCGATGTGYGQHDNHAAHFDHTRQQPRGHTKHRQRQHASNWGPCDAKSRRRETASPTHDR
jgi:hypothetical protein